MPSLTPASSALPSPRRSSPRRLLLHALLLGLALLSLSPLLWLICASVKREEDLYAYTFLPWNHLGDLTLANYARLFQREPFGRWLLNSLFLASVQTTIVVTLCSLGGFALAKYRFHGKKPLMFVMLATMLLPWQILMPSANILMYHLGWINSYAAIVVPGAVSAFGLFLFRQAMQAVPDELLHSGRMDGCSELRLWWEVALPVVRPMIGAFTLLSFLASWNNFIWPQIILQDEAKYTLPIGLANMVGLSEYQRQYGLLAAGTVLSVLPVMILFFILQKDFIAGLADGAIKA